MSNYFDMFSNWEDVQEQFHMIQPEPEEVLYAQYDIDGYEGSADVIYRNGDMFYWVHGGHCSCYGLEDQWDPEEYSAELLVAAWERSNWHNIPDSVLQRVREFLPNNYNGA